MGGLARQGTANGFWLFLDHPQQDGRRAADPALALFPFAVARQAHLHQRGHFGLCQSGVDAHFAGVNGAMCPILDVCIDERRLPLFIARATLRELIAGLEAISGVDNRRGHRFLGL